MISQKILESPKSVLILGPRQVGKSTLLLERQPELSIDLGDQAEFIAFTSNPDEFYLRIEQAKPKTVFIQEIQRIPELLKSIQVIINAKKDEIKFFLSGSSARKLRRGSANLFPGRIFTYRLGPLSCLEFQGQMNSLKALSIGCLPEPYFMSSEGPAMKLLGSYMGTYLQEGIINESLVKQVHEFSRFLKVVAENSGRFLDFSKLANKAKVNRSAARRYYELLEDTLLCERLEAYSSDQELDLVWHPKFYLFDVGIVNAVLDNFKVSSDRVGLLFEHLFFNQLKNASYAIDKRIEISHFRTRGGLEVDFIVKFKDQIFAIEVQASEPSEEELGGLKKIDKYLDGKILSKFVACLKCAPKKISGISILPWQEVISEIFAI